VPHGPAPCHAAQRHAMRHKIPSDWEVQCSHADARAARTNPFQSASAGPRGANQTRNARGGLEATATVGAS
jgi:hypothetical protein